MTAAPMLTVIRGTAELCKAARRVPCHRCHVGPGDPCNTTLPGTHLCRLASAVHEGVIAMAEFAPLIPDDFTPATVIEDPGGP